MCLLGAGRVHAADDGKDKARAHLKKGSRLLELGKAKEALKEFEDAFLAYDSPKIHFNIGLAHRALGHNKEARDAFQRFLDNAADADAVSRKEAAEYIKELDAKLAAATEAPPPSPPPSSPAPSASPAVAAAPDIATAPALPPPVPPAASPASEPAASDLVAAPAPAVEEKPSGGHTWLWIVLGGVVLAGAGVTTAVLLGNRTAEPNYPPTDLGTRRGF